MDNKEDLNNTKIVDSSTENEKKAKIEVVWSFCPVCGNKIPKVKNLKFCIKCGTNLQYIQIHKKFQPRKSINPYTQPSVYPEEPLQSISYESDKLSDDSILNTKEKTLWSTGTSIGLPLGAFLLMNIITAGIISLITFFSFDLEIIFALISNPYFIIFLTLFELIFIVVPVLFVGKYLQNPNLENRFALLGLTLRGFRKPEISKEVLLGIVFGIVGLILVFFVSVFTEILLELIFGVEIVHDLNGATSDVDLIISSADVLSIILFSIVMILVVGTSEEILFRGFMQKGLVRQFGNKGGIIVTALIFSLIHLIGVFLISFKSPIEIIIPFLLSFLPYFAISILLGIIYYWRNENLIAVIITHGLYNTLTIIAAFTFYGML